MRLILTAAVLALWIAPPEAEAFFIQRRSIVTSTRTLRMSSTMERPPTSPSSTAAAAGHPFGDYGKPSNQNQNQDYSFGPSSSPPNTFGNSGRQPPTTPGTINKDVIGASSASNSRANLPTDSSFESFVQGRNINNYFAKEAQPSSSSPSQSQPSSFNRNGGAASFSSPDPTATSPSSTPPSSFESFATSGGGGTSTTPSSFESFASNQKQQQPPLSSQQQQSSQQQPSTTPSTPTTSNTSSNNGTADRFKSMVGNAFSNFAQSAKTSSPPSANNGGPRSFGTPPPQQQQQQQQKTTTTTKNSPPPTINTNSFEEYLTKTQQQHQRPPQATDHNNSPFPGTSSSSFTSADEITASSSSSPSPSVPFPGFPGTVDSAVAAAADPSTPLPPYMSPASLEDASVRSANFSPGASPTGSFGASSSPSRPPLYRPPSFASQQQQQRSTEAAAREEELSSYEQQVANIQHQFPAQPTPTGGLAHVTKTRIGLGALPPPSEELVGRLDQVLSQQREFSTRLDTVEHRIDQSAVENEYRTKTLLEEFREDSKKTQAVFMSRINTDLRGMKTTIDKVLTEQQAISQKQSAQEVTLVDMETSRQNLEQKMVTLEKTTSIRSSNLEQAQSAATAVQSRRIDEVITKLQTDRDSFLQQQAEQAQQQAQHNTSAAAAAKDTPTKDELMAFQQVSSEQQTTRMEAFEKYQLERMTKFEDDQRQQLENVVRQYQNQQQNSQQQLPPSQQRNQQQPPPSSQQQRNGTPPPFPPQQQNKNSNGNPPPFPPQQRNNSNNGNPPQFPPQQQQQRPPPKAMDEMDYGAATEQQLQQRLQEAQSRKQQLLDQLKDMQLQEDTYHGRVPPKNSGHNDRNQQQHPPPPPFATRTDSQQQSSQKSPTDLYGAPPPSKNNNGPPDFRRNNGSSSHEERSRQQQQHPSQFKDEEDHIDDEDIEELPQKRSMLRDRLGKSSGEELYQPARRQKEPVDEFDVDDHDDFDDLSEEEEEQFQHERMMRRDPATPPVEMGPRGSRRAGPGGAASEAPRTPPHNGRRGQQQQSRRTPPPPRSGVMGQNLNTGRGGGPLSPNMMHADDDFRDSDHDGSVHKTLGGMRAFKGDEQSPKDGIFEDRSIGRRNNNRGGKKEQRNSNNKQEKAMMPPPPAGGRIHRKHGLETPPASDPILDRKLEHFLTETMKDGPKPHFDKMMEDLLLEKYRPMFPWLKPANVSFLRNVINTYLEHKGCQVDMDLSQSSAKAKREWNQLLDVLSFELDLWTGEKPKIIEEPDNQWGIYGSKNVSLKTTQRSATSSPPQQQQRRGNPPQRGGNPPQQGGNPPTNQRRDTSQRSGPPPPHGNPPPNQRGVMTKEEALRRKQRNDKIFRVSADPTEIGKMMF